MSGETIRPAPVARRIVYVAVLAVAAIVLVYMTVLSNGATSQGTLVTPSGEHVISVELAATPEQREVGLMNRQSMPADQGMLFDFMETRPVTMWMKNTYIPLDMIFMDEAGTVTHVARNTEPLSLDIVSSQGPARYVLELNGGAAARFGVEKGSRLEHPSIGAAAN